MRKLLFLASLAAACLAAGLVVSCGGVHDGEFDSESADLTQPAEPIDDLSASVSTVDYGGASFRLSKLQIYTIDVAQGNSTLIISPTGTTVLVDSGQYAFATNQVVNLLNELGVTHLDYSIATHYDSDHIASFCDIFDAIGVPTVVYDRGGDREASAASPTPAAFTNYLACTGAARTQLTAGTTIALGGGVTLRVLAVGDPDFAGATSDYDTLWDGTRLSCANTENEKSISLLITYGKFDLLLSGDMTGVADPPNQCSDDRLNVEGPVADLITNTLDRTVEVLHLDHHGSQATSNSLAFLQTLAPQVAVESAGDDLNCGPGFNQYGHPGQVVLDRLYSIAIKKIYQTEEAGASYVNTPQACTPASGQTYPRDYHGLAHDFLYSTHVHIASDSMRFWIENATGTWDAYRAN
jgi:beta-lactamase superfamily II metal-dependent hydrolase